jgi:hypothetical protein
MDGTDFPYGWSWDYHRETNRLVTTRLDRRGFDVAPFGGCSADLPTL